LDRDGFLYVIGRREETITLSGGKKVHPEALEKLYGDSPYIHEIAVLQRQGSLVALVLPELTAARTGPSKHIDDAIRVALIARAQELPSYQRLAGYALVREPLPRTHLGKYQRFLLPALYERAAAGMSVPVKAETTREEEELLAHPSARRLCELICNRYAGKSVHLNTSPLLDLGIDSLEWIALSLEVEHQLGLQFSETDIAGIVTLGDLLHLAVTKQQAIGPLPTVALPPEEECWIAPTGPFFALLGLIVYCLNRC
jgi:long-chain acyl-CoA synthetase